MIKTPETDPNHHVVGHKFRAHDGHIYFCDSWDSSCGYLMTLVEENPKGYPVSKKRRNVSEQAITRTFHYVRRV